MTARGAVLLIVVGLGVACRSHDADDGKPAARATDRESEEVGAVRVDAGVAQRVGIVTRTLAVDRRTPTVRLLGELSADPGRTTVVQAAVTGRLLATDGHWPALGDSVAAGAVLGQVSDAKPLVAARAGTVTRVGAQPGQVVQSGQELIELTDFSTLLARIVWGPELTVPAPRTITLAPMANAETTSARAVLVGPAPTVDSLTRAPVYLYRVPKPWLGARPGTPVVASVADPTTSWRGIFVPDDAVVQWQGLPWVYVAREAGEFARVRVGTDRRVAGGFLVEPATTPGSVSGIAPGDAIVIRGAQLLLSQEFRSRTAPGDEGPD